MSDEARMTTDEMRYGAFKWTIGAIVIMFCIACLLAGMGRNIEAIGVGSTIVGLVGLAGVLAAGKQQSESMNANFAEAIRQLGQSAPPQLLLPAPPQQFEASVERGAREGTREGIEQSLSPSGEKPPSDPTARRAAYEGPDLPAGSEGVAPWNR